MDDPAASRTTVTPPGGLFWPRPADAAGSERRSTIPPVPPPKRHPYDQWSPDARALDLVGDKWTLLIIRDLAAGPAPLRRAAAGAARDLDRAAALAPEPHGRRRAAHPPALPRGAAARRLRADRALARADARARRARALGLRLDVDRPAPGRGRQPRRDLPPRARDARSPPPDVRGSVDLVLVGDHEDRIFRLERGRRPRRDLRARRGPGGRGRHRLRRGVGQRARPRRRDRRRSTSPASAGSPRRCSPASRAPRRRSRARPAAPPRRRSSA